MMTTASAARNAAGRPAAVATVLARSAKVWACGTLGGAGLITRMWPRFWHSCPGISRYRVFFAAECRRDDGDALRVPAGDGFATTADEPGDCGPAVEVALGCGRD